MDTVGQICFDKSHAGSALLAGFPGLLLRKGFPDSLDFRLGPSAYTYCRLSAFVLGEPFLLRVGKHQAGYKAELAEVKKRQAVVERLAAKYHLPLVRYQDVFDAALQRARAEHWSWDGVHPTYAGHWLMMQTWLQTVNAFWPRG